MQITSYLDVAITAARQAGKIHKKYFGTNIKAKTKSSSFDLLTVADTLSEKTIVTTIKKHFPDHNFLCEEAHYAKTNSPYTWIVDPLDGTNNFYCKIPLFGASVALAKNKEIIAGAVYNAASDELFYALKNKGAYLNGKKINVSGARGLNQSMLITGFYYDRGEKMKKNLGCIYGFLKKGILGIRRLGAASIDLCYVACGRASGFWEFTLSPWDFAAGTLIVQEAKGKVSDEKGKKLPLAPSFVVASNAKIHTAMLNQINNQRTPW